MRTRGKTICLVGALLLGWLAGAGLERVVGDATSANSSSQAPTTEWAQWGGDSMRNNTPTGTAIPTEWEVGDFDYRTGEWDSSSAENIKWVSKLGSQTYGNAVVSGGKVFVGTNNSGGWLERYPGEIDLGCLIAFDAETGDFLWQHSSEKLPTGRVHDWPLQGICCAPLVEGNRIWFVSSRGEVRCIDTEGFYDEEDDGPETGGRLRIVDIGPTMMADSGEVDADGKPIMVKLQPLVLDGLKKENAIDLLKNLLAERGEEVAGEVSIDTTAADKQWTLSGTFDGVKRDLTAEFTGGTLSIFKTSQVEDKEEADVVWSYNMMDRAKVSRNTTCVAARSPLPATFSL